MILVIYFQNFDIDRVLSFLKNSNISDTFQKISWRLNMKKIRIRSKRVSTSLITFVTKIDRNFIVAVRKSYIFKKVLFPQKGT